MDPMGRSLFIPSMQTGTTVGHVSKINIPAPPRAFPIEPSRERVPSGNKVKGPLFNASAILYIAPTSLRPFFIGMHFQLSASQAKNGVR